MARGHATVLHVGLICTLFNSICAVDLGIDFFQQQQQQQSQVCQVYTLLESLVVIETLVPSNTVLFHPACDCKITINNAPTILETTVTMTRTLRQEPLSTSSYMNPRYPVITNKPNANIPTFYISISDTSDQKRQLKGPQYLKGDGTVTNNTSDAVQIYESNGRLFTINGAPDGTYFTNVDVESITFATQSHSLLTANSIAGSFSLGSTLLWEHPKFDNSHAIFALTPQGLVKAIFKGKIPPGVRRIGLILTRVKDSPANTSSTEVSSTAESSITEQISSTGDSSSITEISTIGAGSSTIRASGTDKTTSTSLQDPPMTTEGALSSLPGPDTHSSTSTAHTSPLETISTLQPVNNPAGSNIRITSSSESSSPSPTETTSTTPPSQTSQTPLRVQTTTSAPTCTPFTDTFDGGLPMTLGLATLASPPNWPFSYASHNSTFDISFGSAISPGSLAFAELNPSSIPTDSILYYQLNSTVPNKTSICQTWGYLYHQQSGLCLTALVNSSTSTSGALFQGSYMALEPCVVCDSKEGFPESDQLFCAVVEGGTLGKWYCIGFMGDDLHGLGYGVLYQEGVVDAVLEEGGGDCIYVAAL